MSPNPIAPSPSCSRAYRTSTDHAAPNVTLKMRMVSTSVRTAAWCRTQRTPSAMSCRMCVVCSSVRCGGSAIREISTAPAATSTASAANGQRLPDGEQERPQRRADQLVDGDEPGHDAAVRQRQVVALHQHRHQRARRVVGERLRGAQQEHRDEHEPDGGDVERHGGREQQQDQGAQRVDGDDQPPPVQPVRHRPGPQPEQQRRQPLEQRGQRDEERVVGPRRHQQRTGREDDAVAEVRAPRRGQQPPEPGAQPARDDGVDDPAHKGETVRRRTVRITLDCLPRRGTRRRTPRPARPVRRRNADRGRVRRPQVQPAGLRQPGDALRHPDVVATAVLVLRREPRDLARAPARRQHQHGPVLAAGAVLERHLGEPDLAGPAAAGRRAACAARGSRSQDEERGEDADGDPRMVGGQLGELGHPRSVGAQSDEKPPSDAIVWPVTQSASSLSSQPISRAVSAGVLHRPPGLWALSAARAASSA